jgi:hypothetical protein
LSFPKSGSFIFNMDEQAINYLDFGNNWR